jgi:hypothetical protein
VKHRDVVKQYTPSSVPSARGPDSWGVRCTVHDVPFKVSASGRPRRDPTATHLAEAGHEIPVSAAPDRLGVAEVCQAPVRKSAAYARRPGPAESPTATH